MLEKTRIRPSMLAGTWYPADPGELAESIDRMLARAAGRATHVDQADIVGIIVPHAGHRYSGEIAASAFQLLAGSRWDFILLIGPSHRIPTHGNVLVADADGYETPLGVMPVAHDLIDALAQNLPVRLLRGDAEHSLEIELPFIQRVLAPWPALLPLMVSSFNLNFCRQAAEVLAAVLHGRRVLLVASSDWSHYYPDSAARRLDRYGLNLLLKLDAEGFVDALAAGRTQACGVGALLIAIFLARAWGVARTVELAYATSADVTGDHTGVVGYAAVALLGNRSTAGVDTHG